MNCIQGTKRGFPTCVSGIEKGDWRWDVSLQPRISCKGFKEGLVSAEVTGV